MWLELNCINYSHLGRTWIFTGNLKETDKKNQTKPNQTKAVSGGVSRTQI